MSCDLALHEGGHVVFGLFGWRFLGVAGGTIMQLLLPAACGSQLLMQGSWAGVGFCAFWVGESLAGASWYAADAQQQVLILISGMSGREGGFHDWSYMLDVLRVPRSCARFGLSGPPRQKTRHHRVFRYSPSG